MAGDRPQLALHCAEQVRAKASERDFPKFCPVWDQLLSSPYSPGSPYSPPPVLQPELSCFGAAQAPHRPTVATNGSFQPQLWQIELSSSLKLGPFPLFTLYIHSDSSGEKIPHIFCCWAGASFWPWPAQDKSLEKNNFIMNWRCVDCRVCVIYYF